MLLAHSRTKGVAAIIALLLILAAIALFRAAPSTAYKEMSVESFVESSIVAQKQNPIGQDLQLSLHTDKWCYLSDDPIAISISLANNGSKPIVVMKTLQFFHPDLVYGALPLVNGVDKTPLITGFRKSYPDEHDFVTLAPDEAVTTYIHNFWDLTYAPGSQQMFPSRLQQKPVKGIYHLAVEYHNGMRGPVKEVKGSGSSSSIVFHDLNAWTGVLISRSVKVEIVDNLEDCIF